MTNVSITLFIAASTFSQLLPLEKTSLNLSFNILSVSQSQNLLDISSGEIIRLPQCSNVYQYIYDNVKKNPKEVALIFEDKKTTYQELDRQVDNYVNLINPKFFFSAEIYLVMCVMSNIILKT